jgi:hypothetical protein
VVSVFNQTTMNRSSKFCWNSTASLLL